MNWSQWYRHGCKRLLAAFALLAAPSAHATWREASTTHFVIYADASESVVRAFAQNLERYHSALEYLTRQEMATPSPSNRVTVYSVGSVDKVRKLYGDKNASRYLSGFYIPRAGGTLAIVPDITAGRSTDSDESLSTLLHEYAHHFIMSSTRFPLPRWANEGMAEYFASASFLRDGSISIGRPNLGRLLENAYAVDVTLPELMDPALYDAKKRTQYDAFYGRSWLLYHALSMDPAHAGKLNRYYAGLVAGKPSLDSAKEAFGDLAAFDRLLDAYARKRAFSTYTIQAAGLKVGPVAVRDLREGEAAVMPLRIRQNRGVDEEEAKALVLEMRAVAARYPKDPAVMAALAEAEHDSGNEEAAVAAADAALAVNPAEVDAHVQKGLALFTLAIKSNLAKDFRAANSAFIALNALENDHPLPLMYFYRNFIERGARPSDLAVQGLEKASEIAPFDEGLHLTLGSHYAAIGKRDMAEAHLIPVAFSPHGGGQAEAARKMLDDLSAPAKTNEGVPAAKTTSATPANATNRLNSSSPVAKTPAQQQ